MRAYRSILAIPSARLLALVMLPIRLGYAMAGLALVLLGQSVTGSYSTGGAALGLFSIGAGALGPFRGRLVDRYGQTTPLLFYVPLFCAGFAVLSVVDEAWVLLILSGVSGALSPPLLASSRPLWRQVVPADLVRTAFALDSASMQATMVAGPALTGVIVALWSPQAAMLVVTVLVMSGGAAFVAMPASRAWPRADAVPRWRAIVGQPAIRVLLLLGALSGITMGSLVVLLPAVSTRYDSPLGAGLLLAVLATGSVLGGTWAGTRHRTDASVAGKRATGLVALTSLVVALGVGFSWPLPLMALALLALGCSLGPAAVYQLELVDRCAPPGTAVTAFAGIVAVEGATVAIGSIAAGAAVDAAWPAAAAVLCATCAGLASAAYRRRQSVLRNGGDQWPAASQFGPEPTDTSSGTLNA